MCNGPHFWTPIKVLVNNNQTTDAVVEWKALMEDENFTLPAEKFLRAEKVKDFLGRFFSGMDGIKALVACIQNDVIRTHDGCGVYIMESALSRYPAMADPEIFQARVAQLFGKY